MKTRTAFLVSTLVTAYFLGLIYTLFRIDTLTGLGEYSLLLLAAIIFGTLAVQYQSRLGQSFLVLLNVSRFFYCYTAVAYLLNRLGLTRMPLGDLGLGVWLFPLGIMLVLGWAYSFGFSNRKRRYIFSWMEDVRKPPLR